MNKYYVQLYPETLIHNEKINHGSIFTVESNDLKFYFDENGFIYFNRNIEWIVPELEYKLKMIK